MKNDKVERRDGLRRIEPVFDDLDQAVVEWGRIIMSRQPQRILFSQIADATELQPLDFVETPPIAITPNQEEPA